MQELKQIVLQETTAPVKRALSQYLDDQGSDAQTEVLYDSLTASEKQIWDDFVNMISAK